MNCRKVREQLDEYVDGVLSADETAALRSHLAACADCRRAVQQYDVLRASLHNVFATATAPLALSSADRRDILAGVAHHLERRSRWRAAWDWLAANPRLAFAPAALALIVLVLAVQVREAPNPGAAVRNPVNYAVDVPFATEVHVFELQNGAVIDAVVTQVASSEASFSATP